MSGDRHGRVHAAFWAAAVLLAGCGPTPAPPPTPQGSDVTFFFVADTHYGLSQWGDNEAPNKATIDRMNALPGTPYPEATDLGEVAVPRGVLVGGDLSDSGIWFNWHGYRLLRPHDGFADDYGVSGEGRVAFPVYEGYGNHDIHNVRRKLVLCKIRQRNRQRNDVRLSDNGLHYSWDWAGVHFVNLNLYPGGPGDAEDSLGFLREDLAQKVGDSRRRVVLYQHYNFDPWSRDWWEEAERDAFHEVARDYNVIAIFNGHTHATDHLVWRGIDVYTVGNARDARFFVVHITPTRLVVVERHGDAWGAQWSKDLSD